MQICALWLEPKLCGSRDVLMCMEGWLTCTCHCNSSWQRTGWWCYDCQNTQEAWIENRHTGDNCYRISIPSSTGRGKWIRSQDRLRYRIMDELRIVILDMYVEPHRRREGRGLWLCECLNCLYPKSSIHGDISANGCFKFKALVKFWTKAGFLVVPRQHSTAYSCDGQRVRVYNAEFHSGPWKTPSSVFIFKVSEA